jgi:hypothetical protein
LNALFLFRLGLPLKPPREWFFRFSSFVVWSDQALIHGSPFCDYPFILPERHYVHFLDATKNLLSCRTQGGLQFSFFLVGERGFQDPAACSLQLFEDLVGRGFSYESCLILSGGISLSNPARVTEYVNQR